MTGWWTRATGVVPVSGAAHCQPSQEAPLPRRSVDQAREVKLETDALVQRIQEAIGSPTLTDGSARTLLADLLVSVQRLQLAEEQLTELTEQVATSHAAIDAERERYEHQLDQLRTDVALLSSIAEANRLVTSDDDPTDALLQSLVDLATGRDPDVRAGILLTDVKGRVAARAVSDADADELCRLQITHGGPAIEALHRGEREVRAASDLAEWPELAAEVDRLGFEWVLSQPIEVARTVRGVFNVYGTGSSAAAENATALLADHAGSAIANRELYLTTRRLVGHLETALESRGVIEQAKGILMAREGCDSETAFDILRRASQRENRKLYEVATTLVEGLARRGRGDGCPS